MYGNWRYNVVIGLTGSVLVFLLSLTNNLLFSSLLRACYGFIVFFLIAYIIRYLIGHFIFSDNMYIESSEASEDSSGQNIDYMAHQEDENLNDLLKEQLAQNAPNVNKGNETANSQPKAEDESFKPLKPTQLFSSKSAQPEEMSKAIRHLTGE